MEKKQLIYEELVKEEDSIVQRMIQEISKLSPELYLEWKILQKLKSKYSPNGEGEQPEAGMPQPLDSTKIKSTIQVVRNLFRTNPLKEYSPSDIRDYLNHYIEQGVVTSVTEDVLRIAHRTLRSLGNQGYIVKIKREGEYPVYKLKEKEKGLLE